MDSFKIVCGLAGLGIVAALFGYTSPKVNYDSQQVFCLEAVCLSGAGFNKQCLESQPRIAQLHVVEHSGVQRVVFEMTPKLCGDNNGNVRRVGKPAG